MDSDVHVTAPPPPSGTGSAACSHLAAASFLCPNEAFRSERIFASRVGDGVCDCCDGSDEPKGRCGQAQHDTATVVRSAAAALTSLLPGMKPHAAPVVSLAVSSLLSCARLVSSLKGRCEDRCAAMASEANVEGAARRPVGLSLTLALPLSPGPHSNPKRRSVAKGPRRRGAGEEVAMGSSTRRPQIALALPAAPRGATGERTRPAGGRARSTCVQGCARCGRGMRRPSSSRGAGRFRKRRSLVQRELCSTESNLEL